ncbi:MAG: chorismate mutase [Rhodospirillaceae bacterium]|jgi:chorismate mutase / prephenate dehydratase|nr:chorismate mutase [Rhodospirillaceae bacterium]MBT6118387.1 chorismate mutase [Rhodospirillaceae bacterium]
MTSAPPSLDELRREIDEIDDAVHDLLMRRAEVVERVGTAKAGTVSLRPAREALIMRRLLSRHKGPFSRAVLVRIWREILSASVRLQGPFSVAAPTDPDGTGPDYWTVARDAFGSQTPIADYRSAEQVVLAVKENAATVGVLPMLSEDDPAPWWPALAVPGEGMPRIIARLPFGPPGVHRGPAAEALAIARVEQAATGDDCSFVVVETDEGVSRSRVSEGLRTVGLSTEFVASCRGRERPDSALHIAEIHGYVGAGDQRLADLAALGGGVRRALQIGGYASPLSGASLADTDTASGAG